MSRTDKTAPFYVKKTWIPREHHDHRFGECDLPDAPTAQNCQIPWEEKYKHCYWDTDWDNPLFRCGCPWCSYDNRYTKRKSRRRAKADIHHERWDDLTKYGPPDSHYC